MATLLLTWCNLQWQPLYCVGSKQLTIEALPFTRYIPKWWPSHCVVEEFESSSGDKISWRCSSRCWHFVENVSDHFCYDSYLPDVLFILQRLLFERHQRIEKVYLEHFTTVACSNVRLAYFYGYIVY